MKKQIILVAIFSLIILGFGFTDFAQAALLPNSKENTSATIETPDQVGSGSLAALLLASGGAVAAVTITPSDLGVDNVGTLPTSNFYFLKEWGRGIDRLFTWRAISKAKLELRITNEKAAELLEVEKVGTVGANGTMLGTSLKKALENYTDAQERLNTKLAKLTETSENPNVAKLLEEVDEKTAKHVELLEQVARNITTGTGTVLLEDLDEKTAKHVELLEQVARNITTGTGTIVNDDADLSKILNNALNNIQKTFTITVTSVNDAPALKQKAEEQIKLAGQLVQTVTVGAEGILNVRVQSPFKDFANPDGSSNDELDIFDRWGNMIAKAKGNLENAKKSFADGEYGEAYGQARSAEAMAVYSDNHGEFKTAPSPKAIGVPGDYNGDGLPDKTAPTASPKQSPKVETPKPSPKSSVSPTTKPTPEKTETPASAGSPVR